MNPLAPYLKSSNYRATPKALAETVRLVVYGAVPDIMVLAGPVKIAYPGLMHEAEINVQQVCLTAGTISHQMLTIELCERRLSTQASLSLLIPLSSDLVQAVIEADHS